MQGEIRFETVSEKERMQNLDNVLATLQFCRESLSVFASPVHKERIDTIEKLLLAEASTGQAPCTEGMLLSDYLYSVSLFRLLAQDHPAHLANLAAVEEFLITRLRE